MRYQVVIKATPEQGDNRDEEMAVRVVDSTLHYGVSRALSSFGHCRPCELVASIVDDLLDGTGACAGYDAWPTYTEDADRLISAAQAMLEGWKAHDQKVDEELNGEVPT